jgi:NTF2 fold immunity protein
MKVFLVALIMLNTNFAFLNTMPIQEQQRNYVPNAECAIKIAEAIWLPIYGKGIYDSKPFTAVLKGDSVWVVEGTLPKRTLGGTPYIEIQKSDCKILKVTHGK